MATLNRQPCPMTRKHQNLRSPFAATCLLLLSGLFLCTGASAQNVDDGFLADADNEVLALAVQGDGKIIVGGRFSNIAGHVRQRIARLNADGSIDTGFAATTVDPKVTAVLVQADGRIVIGGAFTQVGTLVRNGVARLHADGSLDAVYAPAVNNAVWSLAIQTDGKMILGVTSPALMAWTARQSRV